VTLSDAMTEGEPAQVAECISCAGGTLERDRISTALWRGADLVVIEGIPALVCQSCGERYFEDEVAMALDMMRDGSGAKEPPARIMSVPVFEFAPPGSPQTGKGPS